MALDGRHCQIEKRYGKKVVVEERLDGSLYIMSKGIPLKYGEITERPQKGVVHKAEELRMYNRPPKPAKDHPWKR